MSADSTVEQLYADLNKRLAAYPELERLNLGSLARPAVRLAACPTSPALLARGESRIGGAPDVPPGFEWPRWLPSSPRDDKYATPWRPDGPAPLAFIAQIDLSEIPRVDDSLPKSGWLYFFYDLYCETWGFDPADRGACRIVYVDCDRSELVRTEAPTDADAEHSAELCRAEAWPELTLPSDLAEVPFDSPISEAYQKLRDELHQAGSPHHHLLGYPQVIQNPMELECQLASHGVNSAGTEGYDSQRAAILTPGAVDWRLLLQIDTDDGPGWMWGDMGTIYFWIKQQDLAALRFDDAWLILQCS